MKKMTLWEKYKNVTPIAVYPNSAWGGCEILDIIYDINDYVITAYNYGIRFHIRKNKLYSNSKGTYFTKEGKRYYLDTFEKVGK